MLDFDLNYQGVAVALYVGRSDGVESSWDDNKGYAAKIRFRPWYNCRETGIVIQMTRGYSGTTVNYAVFEHRNSDEICCWRWESGWQSDNPTVHDIPEGVAPDKYHHSHRVKWGEVAKMAAWIQDDMDSTWLKWGGLSR